MASNGSQFPRHQKRGHIEASVLEFDLHTGKKHFRAIKSAVTLKQGKDGVTEVDHADFRAIKSAVTLKLMVV